MVEHGLGPRLLVRGLRLRARDAARARARCAWSTCFKQGTFYPFAPTGPDQRDNELELRVRSFLGDDLPMEKDLVALDGAVEPSRQLDEQRGELARATSASRPSA